MSLAELRERRRRNARRGLCVCGEKNARGRSWCARHLREQREHQRELRERRKAEGRCIRCERPAQRQRTLCQEHQIKAWAYQAARAATVASRQRDRRERKRRRKQVAREVTARRVSKRKAQGLCPACAEPAEPERVHCAACRAYIQAYRRRLRQDRARALCCTACGEPVGRFDAQCDPCRRQSRRRVRAHRRKARKLGKCLACKRLAAPGRRHCAEHLHDRTEAQLRYLARSPKRKSPAEVRARRG